jgi:hypothetical protein
MNSKLKANKGCVLVFSFEKWSFYTRAYFMTAIKIKLEKVLSTVIAQSYFQLSLCSMQKGPGGLDTDGSLVFGHSLLH